MKRLKCALALLLVLVLTAAMGALPASAAAPERPVYHYTPKLNWCNDPNGLIYFNGEWHMYYQYNPYGTSWGNMSWGHATSLDLVHWTEQKVALLKDELGDIFSGSAVYDKDNTTGFFEDGKGGIVAIFTHAGSRGQVQSLAYSADGYTFTKYAGNPVLDREDDPLGNEAFRDPKVFWHEESEQWMMIVAGGPVRFFSSKNLIDWKAEGMHNEYHTECPDFYQMTIEGTNETRWVLNEGGRAYRIGDFQLVNGKWSFVPDLLNDGRYAFDFGPDAYAAQSYANTPDGSIITTQWMSSWGYAPYLAPVTSPYNGTYTLNNRLTLVREPDGNLRLRQNPVEGYEALRDTASQKTLSTTLLSGGTNPLVDWSGTQYELLAEFTPDDEATEVGVKLRTGDGRCTTVLYNLYLGRVSVDRREAGTEPVITEGEDLFNKVYRSEFIERDPETIKLRIFVDSTSVEVFVNDGQAVGSFLIFPDETQTGLEAFVTDGSAGLELTMYPLSTAYPPTTSTPESSAPTASVPESATSAPEVSVENDLPQDTADGEADRLLPAAIAAGAVVVAAVAVTAVFLLNKSKKDKNA